MRCCVSAVQTATSFSLIPPSPSGEGNCAVRFLLLLPAGEGNCAVRFLLLLPAGEGNCAVRFLLLLPAGEGKCAVRFLLLLPAGERNYVIRFCLPLPVGEGRGKGIRPQKTYRFSHPISTSTNPSACINAAIVLRSSTPTSAIHQDVTSG